MASTHTTVSLILSVMIFAVAVSASNVYSDPCLDQTNSNQCSACLDTYIPTNDTLGSIVGSGSVDVTPVVYPPGSISSQQAGSGAPVPLPGTPGSSDGIGLFQPTVPPAKSGETQNVVTALSITVVLVAWLIGL